MNIFELEDFLWQSFVAPASFSIGEDDDTARKVCIVEKDFLWHVYINEEGTILREEVFTDEDTACEYFIYLLQMPYGEEEPIINFRNRPHQRALAL